MLHTKFRGNRSTGPGEYDFLKGFTIYGHGGLLGHVTQHRVNEVSFSCTCT